MSDYTLVLVDTTGIQSYIFGSNRLRENVGASHLVYLATEGWLRTDPALLLGTEQHNLRNGKIAEELYIENDLDAELLYAGGGNTVVLFRNDGNDTSAKRFTRNLSWKLIAEAPGLEVVTVRQEVDLENGSLAQAFKSGFEQLGKRKADRERSQPLLGLGVTAACQSTGLVANHEQSEPSGGSQLVISSEVKAKWDNNGVANKRLNDALGDLLSNHYEFPLDFDDLGRSKGDSSYIAVVHADGNGMGKTLQKIIEKYGNHIGKNANRELIAEIRGFSNAVNEAGLSALRSVVEEIVHWSEQRHANRNDDAAEQNSGKLNLSIRPIVFGGDDVTFVCDGRIGLKAAQIFLNAFNAQKIPDEEGKNQFGRAAAGVTVVKTHYPFSRAYQLSEELCKNAKSVFERKTSALDWHLAQSGLFGDLSDIRQREYNERYDDQGKVSESLLMRPLIVNDNPIGEWHTWQNLVSLLALFRNIDQADSDQWPRNKVMQLREAIRHGHHAVEIFTAGYKELPTIKKDDSQHTKTGLIGRRSAYFDAIEMIEQEVW